MTAQIEIDEAIQDVVDAVQAVEVSPYCGWRCRFAEEREPTVIVSLRAIAEWRDLDSVATPALSSRQAAKDSQRAVALSAATGKGRAEG